MDSGFPAPPSSPVSPTDWPTGLPDEFFAPPVRRRKFQHRYAPHVILLLLTLLTTSFTDAFGYLWFEALPAHDPRPLQLFNLATFTHGLWYSIPLLLILGAHEFGHYFACRYHDVDATLPFFLPLPLPPSGTLGAVIRIREPFPSKEALFDIGVAGPIAGFLMLLPVLFAGVAMSHVVPITEARGVEYGEPLLFKLVASLQFGAIPDGYEVMLHPLGFAAWWGMLATALNLLPFGQLDGGHVVYSLLGRRAVYASVATLGGALLLTTRSLGWISIAVMMLVMAFFLGVRHPRIRDEDTPLDARRRLVALCALVIFVLCFTPVPIETFIGK